MTNITSVCSPSVAYILALGAVALTAKLGVPDIAAIAGMVILLSHQIHSTVDRKEVPL
jgi:hypothetical protein